MGAPRGAVRGLAAGHDHRFDATAPGCFQHIGRSPDIQPHSLSRIHLGNAGQHGTQVGNVGNAIPGHDVFDGLCVGHVGADMDALLRDVGQQGGVSTP